MNRGTAFGNFNIYLMPLKRRDGLRRTVGGSQSLPVRKNKPPTARLGRANRFAPPWSRELAHWRER